MEGSKNKNCEQFPVRNFHPDSYRESNLQIFKINPGALSPDLSA
jgi:hypothetical protein